MSKKKSDIPNPDLRNINALQQKDVTYIFGRSRATVQEWVKKKSCPVKSDGKDSYYNLLDVIQWREKFITEGREGSEGKDAKYNEEVLKLQNQNKKYKLEIEDKEKKTISRERHEEIQQIQAQALMSFLTNGYQRNAPEMMRDLGLPADKMPDFIEAWDKFIKSAMDSFVDSGVNV